MAFGTAVGVAYSALKRDRFELTTRVGLRYLYSGIDGFTETGAAGGKDMGKVMGWIKPKAQGRTDMGKLSGLIKARLG